MPIPAKKTWLWWSTGKDSAWALHELRKRDAYAVTALVTTVTAPFERVSMHSTREQLLKAQTAAAGLPLRAIRLPHPCSNEDYEAAVQPLVAEAAKAGVECMAFGDLFLEDVRAYREELIEGSGIEPIFPLWGRATSELAREMIVSGLHARITCLDPSALPKEVAGTKYDQTFIDTLPPGVDPCGENGEFHTFCWDGPMFMRPIPVRVGEIVEREGFVFADVLPAEGGESGKLRI